MDFIQIFLCYSAEIGFFWDILSDESVGILIGSSFPRVVFMSKIYLYLQFKAHHLVISKLPSIVESNRLELISWNVRHESHESCSNSYSILSEWELSNKCLSCLAFYECKYSSFSIFSDDGISFPMSNFFSCLTFWMIYDSIIDHDSFSYLVFSSKSGFFPSISVLFVFSSKMFLEKLWIILCIYPIIDSILGEFHCFSVFLFLLFLPAFRNLIW